MYSWKDRKNQSGVRNGKSPGKAVRSKVGFGVNYFGDTYIVQYISSIENHTNLDFSRTIKFRGKVMIDRREYHQRV